MKKPKEELRITVEFDQNGMPSLPSDGEYPEWVHQAIEEWRASLVAEKNN